MSDDAPAADNEPGAADDGPSAGDAPVSTGPFDLAAVRDLLSVMQRFDVTEIDLKGERQEWHVRRGQVAAPPAAAAPAPVAAAPAVMPEPAAPAAPAPATAPAAPSAGGKTIDSPTVGTFYDAPSPDDPAFVKVGDTVSADTVVCLVEAMKVFNQIQAETSGSIAEVLVKSGDPVEFGQPLFRLA